MFATIPIVMLVAATGFGVIVAVLLVRAMLRGSFRASTVVIPVLLVGSALFLVLQGPGQNRLASRHESSVQHDSVRSDRPTAAPDSDAMSWAMTTYEGVVETRGIVASQQLSKNHHHRQFPSVFAALALLVLLYVGYVVLSATTRRCPSRTRS